MATPTQSYVDPALAGNVGTGTIADPYGDIQFALDTAVQDVVNGDQFNIKSGTDELPVAVLDTVIYGNPAADAPLIFRGYDEVANDGGVGGIDGGAGGFSIMDQQAAGEDWTHFIDMHLHNTGAVAVCRLQDYSSLIRCELHAGSIGGVFGTIGLMVDNYVYDCTQGLVTGFDGVCRGNYVVGGATNCIFIQSSSTTVTRNIVVATGVATIGIVVSNTRQRVIGNSIISTAAGTAAGIEVDANTHDGLSIMDNLIEGFSGVGGAGIDFGSLTRHVQIYTNNSFFGNTDDEINRGDFNYEQDNDLAMTESPFQKVGALTFANRFNYFKPVRIGSVKGGAFPNGSRFDRGAVNGPSVIERVIQEQTTVTIPERTVFDQIPD